MTEAPVTERERFLANHPVFSPLEDGQIAALAARLSTRRCADGETIFVRGDHGNSLAIVARGRVALRLASARGREFTLAILQAGDILGELSVLDGKPRSADAMAFGGCELLVINRRDLLPLLRASPDACLAMLELSASRMRRTSDQLEALALHPLSARLARLLLALCGAEAAISAPEDVTLSQRDIALLVGASREKVNLQLRRWMNDGILAREHGRLAIRDIRALAAIADAVAE